MTPAATMERGVKLASIKPDRIAGITCAIAATFSLIPSISPYIFGTTELLMSPVIFAWERPLANTKNVANQKVQLPSHIKTYIHLSSHSSITSGFF